MLTLKQKQASGPIAPLPPLPGGGTETIGDFLGRNRWGLLALLCGYLLLFFPTLRVYLKYCFDMEDFSHCPFIPVLSAGILVANRKKIARYPSRLSPVGLVLTATSLAAFAAGYLLTINVLQRIGMFGCLAGLAVFLLGGELLRRHRFPFLFLVLALPIPYILYRPTALRLQIVASRISTALLELTGVPVAEQGNVLNVGGETLFVAEACSGIRSLLAILSIAVLFAYVFRAGVIPGSLLVLIAVPVTLFVNILRIFLTAWLLHHFGINLTKGPIHEFMGLILFSVSLVFLYLNWLFIKWLFMIRPPGDDEGEEMAAS